MREREVRKGSRDRERDRLSVAGRRAEEDCGDDDGRRLRRGSLATFRSLWLAPWLLKGLSHLQTQLVIAKKVVEVNLQLAKTVYTGPNRPLPSAAATLSANHNRLVGPYLL